METKTGKPSAAKEIDNKVELNPQADATYLVNCLRPTSTPLEILYAIAMSPDTVAVTTKQFDMANQMREMKRAGLLEKSKEAAHKSTEDLVDDDGWAEDDVDDPAAAAALKAKDEKEREAKRLAKATGKADDMMKTKLEGVDEGVLGQEWVIANLTKMGSWPPPSMDKTIINDKKFSVDGTIVGPLDHPGVRRALVMTMGRLNAKELNTHPELLAAGPKGMIDPTYFQATVEYRQRVGQVLEGSLRMACTLRSYRLACSILDAIVMFKIGLEDADSKEHLTWFNNLMMKQYGPTGVPKLIIEDKYLGVPTPEPEEKKDAKDQTDAEKKEAEKEAAKNKFPQQIMQTKQVTTTDEKMALEMKITRQHAESFTRQKLAQCQKQGVPPQVALQSYREAWFIIVRAKKINDDGSTVVSWNGALGESMWNNHMDSLKAKGDQLYGMLDSDTVKSFTNEFASNEKNYENKIVIGWPFVISNVAQKTGGIKVHLPPPIEAGRYEFSVTIKSQEFLGVGEEFKLVVDVAKGVEKKKKEEEDSETKKDK